MTLSKAYEELMGRIEVTPELRRRVLERIEAEVPAPARPRVVRIPAWKKYLSAAACLVLVIAGAAMLPKVIPSDPPGNVQVVPNIQEAQSLSQLSELVGFTVSEDFTLPFTPEKTVYCSYWNEMAQIQYSGEGQTATYRQSAGTEDNSGNYTDYGDTAEVADDGPAVTLRGDGGVYTLAVWTDGTFSYSLALSHGATLAGWLTILGR